MNEKEDRNEEQKDVYTIMYDHLKLLAESSEECEDKDLLPITQAMVTTAAFIVQLEQNA